MHSNKFFLLKKHFTMCSNEFNKSNKVNKSKHPFIVIEGIDKTGKSTIARLIAERKNFDLYEYPNRTTPIGQLIDIYLKQEPYEYYEFNNQKSESKEIRICEIENNVFDKKNSNKNKKDKKKAKNILSPEVANLLFSANRYESAHTIINRNKGIITARYKYSGFAGGALNNLPKDWVRQCDAGLPEPTHLFFIDSNFDEVKNRRMGKEDEIYETEKKAKLFYKYLKEECLNSNAYVLEGGHPLEFYVDLITKMIENN